MELVHPQIDRYLHEIATPRDEVLREMERVADERSFPIVGPQVGRLLALLTRSIGARRVLELGSGFGYSAYWFAGAVGPAGQVVLTERSAERCEEARRYLARGGWADRVRIEVDDGLAVLERIEGEFDVVFNDIDKADYPRVLDGVTRVLRPGGLLISDNMLWSGKVLGDAGDDPETLGVKELTRQLLASEAFETVVLPVRDGVAVALRGG